MARQLLPAPHTLSLEMWKGGQSPPGANPEERVGFHCREAPVGKER